MSEIVIDNLSPDERLALIGELWDSLDDSEIPLTAAQREELDRRLEAMDADASNNLSWEQVKAAARRR